MSDANQAMKKTVQASPAVMVPEEELWSGRYSGKAMYGTWIVAGLLTLAAVIGMVMISAIRQNTIAFWIAIGIVLAIWLALGTKFAYHKLVHYYELSNQRLRHREGILVQTLNRIELVDIDDISSIQGPIQRMLNVGHITIKSRDVSHPMLVMYGISDVRRVVDMIDNARLEERRRRAVRFESL